MTQGNKTALLLVSGAMLCSAVSADACGWSMSPGEFGVLLAVVGTLIAIPVVLASAGLIAAYRTRRSGRFSPGRSFFIGSGLLVEFGLGQSCGWGSLVGLACLGLMSLKVMLLAGAAAFGRAPEPLHGDLTVMADEKLFASVPR